MWLQEWRSDLSYMLPLLYSLEKYNVQSNCSFSSLVNENEFVHWENIILEESGEVHLPILMSKLGGEVSSGIITCLLVSFVLENHRAYQKAIFWATFFGECKLRSDSLVSHGTMEFTANCFSFLIIPIVTRGCIPIKFALNFTAPPPLEHSSSNPWLTHNAKA